MSDSPRVRLENVTLSVLFAGRRVTTLDDVTAPVPAGRVALVGESRVAAVSLIDLLIRRTLPQAGRVRFMGRVSWPLGHTAPFSVSVTGKQVVTHFSAIYGFDRRAALDFIHRELGWSDLHLPMEIWPRTVQTKFMLLLGLIPDFDQYIVDGNLIVADDPAFTKRFMQLFHHRSRDKAVLIAARQMRLAKAMCSQALIVAQGKVEITDDVAGALKLNEHINLGRGGTAPDEADGTDPDDLLI